MSASVIQINPDGRRVAYPVRSPDLSTNEDRIEIYVKNLNEQTPGESRPRPVSGRFMLIHADPRGIH